VARGAGNCLVFADLPLGSYEGVTKTQNAPCSMGLIFHVVVLIAEGISLAFLGFSLLVGIQALTGLAEEFPTSSKRLLRALALLVLLLQVLLLAIDGLPPVPVAVGCLAHYTYYLWTWKDNFVRVRVRQLLLISTVVLFLVSNVVWAQTLWHFYDPWIYSHRMTSDVASWREGLLARNTFTAAHIMFICVWLLPLSLLLVFGSRERDAENSFARDQS
jgi:hypothetical protein